MTFLRLLAARVRAWWDAHACECGATLIIFMSLEEHRTCMRHLGWAAGRELYLEIANAALDAAYERHHHTLPGRLCDPLLCRAPGHARGCA